MNTLNIVSIITRNNSSCTPTIDHFNVEGRHISNPVNITNVFSTNNTDAVSKLERKHKIVLIYKSKDKHVLSYSRFLYCHFLDTIGESVIQEIV